MKTLTLTLALFAFTISHSQITTTKVAEAAEKKYDSTENFLGEDATGYKGQELYLRGQVKELRSGGYTDFVLDYTKDKYDQKNVYKPNSDGFGSTYESLAEKYFLVLDVIKNEEDNSKFFLKLQEKESKDVVYYIYDSRYPNSFPFVCTGYFIKSKTALVGKKYMVKGKNWLQGEGKPMLDMKTGLPVSEFEAGGVWQIVDLTVEEKYYTLAFVIENSKHEQITLPVDNTRDNFWVYNYDDAIAYQKKFGDAVWQLILQGKVKNGMTKEACKLSWGDPKDVVKTKSDDGKELEAWSYDDNSLYFANGVLFESK